MLEEDVVDKFKWGDDSEDESCGNSFEEVRDQDDTLQGPFHTCRCLWSEIRTQILV